MAGVSHIHTNRLPALALNGTDIPTDEADVTANDARSQRGGYDTVFR